MAANEIGQRLKARELNELIRYTMWSVFRVADHRELAGGSGAEAKIRDAIAIEVNDLLGQAEGKGIVTRGCYDVQGMRADADYMFWWIAPSSDDLQEIYSRFRATRLGEEALLQRDDAELAALAAADLAAATGVRGAPLDTRVSRWGGSLPQYTVGHLDRVAGIRAALAAQPGLAACGASYAGIGIPACIASAAAAADQVIAYLGTLAAVGPGPAAGRRGGQ